MHKTHREGSKSGALFMRTLRVRYKMFNFLSYMDNGQLYPFAKKLNVGG
jgi:hypothetical protein